ncbi:MAG: hypothetical protein FWD32_01670 [Firmicutes bacterium]|nr:hypothetical protein [Bacillota bacterium]
MKKILVLALVIALGAVLAPFAEGLKIKANDGFNNLASGEFYITLTSNNQAIQTAPTIRKGAAAINFQVRGTNIGSVAGDVSWGLKKVGSSTLAKTSTGFTFSVAWTDASGTDAQRIGNYELIVMRDDFEANIIVRFSYDFPQASRWDIREIKTTTGNLLIEKETSGPHSGKYVVIRNTPITIYNWLESETNEDLFINDALSINWNNTPSYHWEIYGPNEEGENELLQKTLPEQRFDKIHNDYGVSLNVTLTQFGEYTVKFYIDDNYLFEYVIVSVFDATKNDIKARDANGAVQGLVYTNKTRTFVISPYQNHNQGSPNIKIIDYTVTNSAGVSILELDNTEKATITLSDDERSLTIKIPYDHPIGIYQVKLIVKVAEINDEEFEAFYTISVALGRNAEDIWWDVLLYGSIAAALGGLYFGVSYGLKWVDARRAMRRELEAQMSEGGYDDYEDEEDNDYDDSPVVQTDNVDPWNRK